MSAGTYNVIADFGTNEAAHGGSLSMDPYWVIAVVRLGTPLSFSRKKLRSVDSNVSVGALTRAVRPLVITDDCLQLSIQNSKRSHTKSLSATLKATDINYLVELLPGDWAMAWLVNNKADFESLLARIGRGEACNQFKDGLKFVGRVHSVYSDTVVNPDGEKSTSISLQCTGFSELETQFFYDNSLASKDVLERDLGQWMARLGVEYEKLFAEDAATGVKKNNINQIIPKMIDLIVGDGPSKVGNISVDAANGQEVSSTPTLASKKSAGGPEYAYMIPLQVGNLLGVKKEGRVISYSDILELLQGVQKYESKSDWRMFVPQLKSSEPRRRITTVEMLGTFLPFFPEFTNTPLWSVLNRYLNPTINEMYTCLRVNPEGLVMPTIVLRQIPFTTEAFVPSAIGEGDKGGGTVACTRFVSEMPRWRIPAVMIRSVRVGRSDATRFNFVHIYGQSSYQANNNPIPNQIVQNPPVRDDIDIMRSGLRSYMTTVECWVDDQIGQVPSSWMKLVADWTIGSHLTFNGTLTSFGIQSPIAEGDNIEFDGVVYHIEGLTHSAGITSRGTKTWTTSLQLTNGMRAYLGNAEEKAAGTESPLYPGFRLTDNTAYNPGLSLEQMRTTSPTSLEVQTPGDFVPDSIGNIMDRTEGASQLDPAADKKKPAKRPRDRKKK